MNKIESVLIGQKISLPENSYFATGIVDEVSFNDSEYVKYPYSIHFKGDRKQYYGISKEKYEQLTKSYNDQIFDTYSQSLSKLFE